MTSTKVFISSLMDEMAEERNAAEKAIRSLQMRTTRFEIFPARPESAAEVSLEEVKDSEIFVQILGRGISRIVVREYESAMSCDCQILLFVKDVERTVQAEKHLEKLRKKHTYKKFSTPKELEDHIRYSIQSLLTKALRRGKKDRPSKIAEEILFDRKVTLGLFASSTKWVGWFKVLKGDRIKGLMRSSGSFSAYLLTEEDYADFEAGDEFHFWGREKTKACAIDVKAEDYDTWYLVLKDETYFGTEIYVKLSRIKSS